MDIYESAMTALKIPFFPLRLRFPAGDVLKAVMILERIILIVQTVSCLLSPVSFSLFLSLFSQSFYYLPMTNDQ